MCLKMHTVCDKTSSGSLQFKGQIEAVENGEGRKTIWEILESFVQMFPACLYSVDITYMLQVLQTKGHHFFFFSLFHFLFCLLVAIARYS